MITKVRMKTRKKTSPKAVCETCALCPNMTLPLPSVRHCPSRSPRVRDHPGVHGQLSFALVPHVRARVHARLPPSLLYQFTRTIARPHINGRPHVTVHSLRALTCHIRLAFTMPSRLPPPTPASTFRPRVNVQMTCARALNGKRSFSNRCFSSLPVHRGRSPSRLGSLMRSLRPRATVHRSIPSRPSFITNSIPSFLTY